MSTTIVFATDFSDTATVAQNVALATARHLRAEVVCVHAVVMTEARPDAYELSTGQLEAFRSAVQEDIVKRRERLEQVAKWFHDNGTIASAKLADGPTVDTICAEAERLDATLVVVGSHGRTGVGRFLLGSVAERVARLCPRSVLVARPPIADSRGFQRVLIPTDFSPLADVALEQATEITAHGARLDILHALQLHEFPDGPLLPLGPDAGHHVAAAKAAEQARATGEALAASVTGDQRDIAFHLVEGRAQEGIHSFLEDGDSGDSYDLVVVGTHGRTGIKRLLLGSVAEYVVRHAPCSVLVARAKA